VVSRSGCHTSVSRTITDSTRHGEVEKALAEYKRHERIVMAPDPHTLGERLVSDWWSSGGPNGGIMIALRRTDVRTLNRLARIAMRDAGRLNGDELLCGEESISAGDVVVLRLNDPRRGVTNGDRGTVLSAAPDHLLVDLAGRVVELDHEYLSRFTNHGDPVVAHGYAVTGHVAQGLTTDRAFVLASDEIYREWGYTAMSRGRAMNRLYLVEGAPRVRDELAPRQRSTADAELLSTLRQTRRQRMALDVENDGQVPLRDHRRDREAAEPQQKRRWWRGRSRRDDVNQSLER
jgi:hypothetical protein